MQSIVFEDQNLVYLLSQFHIIILKNIHKNVYGTNHKPKHYI
jgi:hypothetical protein